MKRFYLLTLLVFFSVVVSAVNVEIDGIVYNINVKTGFTEVAANPYHPYTGDIVIPETITYEGTKYTVTAIGQGAFSQRDITSITFPNSITSIGAVAFANCKLLDTIVLPEKVTVILDSSFANCQSLRRVVFPESLTYIENSAFNGCYSLDSVSIPHSVTTIEDWAFNGCMLEHVFVKSTDTRLHERAFSPNSYYHAMLYIPVGSWSGAVYQGDFWRFINIRETATKSDELSSNQAYTLMKANTFDYIVYDAVNDRTALRKAYYQVDENSADNSWQIVEDGDKNYLYNIGAKKFAQPTADGLLQLTETPAAINMKNGEAGIVIGENNQSQLIFVQNDKVNAKDFDGIESVNDRSRDHDEYYTTDGIKVNHPRTGLYIVKSKNGKTRKMITVK